MDAIAGFLTIIIFPTLGVMVLVWFRQITRLFSYLEQNHLVEYESMGKPNLILNNTPKSNIAFLRFLLSNRPCELGDAHLAKWCGFLKRFFYSYLMLFFGLIVLISGVNNAS